MTTPTTPSDSASSGSASAAAGGADRATDAPPISIILPARNEERYIAACIESVLAQDYPHGRMELIIADGMSTDRTRAIIAEYTQQHPWIRVIDNPGLTPPHGLNAAIREARGELILRMDAHAEYAPDYVSLCVRYLQLTGADNAGGTLITLPGGTTRMAACISAITSHPLVVGGSAFRSDPRPRYSDGCVFGTWRRELFDQIGLFNEALSRNQDNEFNARIIRFGGKIYQTPRIGVKYYNQATLRGLLRQAYRNGVWHVLALVANPASFRLRYIAPFAFDAWLLLFLILSFVHWLFLIPLLGGLGLYAIFLALVTAQIVRKDGLRLLCYVPGAVFAYHVWYGAGWFVGIVRFLIFGRAARQRARAGSSIPDPANPPKLGTRAIPEAEAVRL